MKHKAVYSQIPDWLDKELSEWAKESLSTKAQIIRELLLAESKKRFMMLNSYEKAKVQEGVID